MRCTGHLSAISNSLLKLFRVELTDEMDVAFNPVDLAFPGFAVPAIRRMNLGMSKIHGDSPEGPFLRSRVQDHRHRRAGTERGDNQIIRGQPMRTGNNLLGEPRRFATDDYIRGTNVTSVLTR